MPVQINEVIIRAVVDPRPGEKSAEASACSSSSSGGSGNDAEIMEKVLEIIREKTER